MNRKLMLVLGLILFDRSAAGMDLILTEADANGESSAVWMTMIILSTVYGIAAAMIVQSISKLLEAKA